MKIVILAAGKGSRLNRNVPKPLIPLINGKSILEIQIENLCRYFSLKDIYTVIGFQKEKFYGSFSHMNFIENPNYEQENTSKSLLRALNHIGLDDDLLWLNGDVLFYPLILQDLKEQTFSTMVVNEGSVGEEEIKYRLNEKGNIIEVSKSVMHGKGEAVGINLVIKKDLLFFKENLIACTDQDYFEKALELSIQKKELILKPLIIPIDKCIEIDFQEDIEKANALVISWEKI